MAELPVIHEINRGSDSATRCKHYRGMHENTHCEAGVEFASVRVEGQFKYRYKGDKTVYTHGACYPCMGKWDFAGATCPKRDLPTAEEVAAEEAEFRDLFGRTVRAREAIVSATGGKRGVVGQVDCPICLTGKLGYTVSGYNGHIHARCSTENCVCWME